VLCTASVSHRNIIALREHAMFFNLPSGLRERSSSLQSNYTYDASDAMGYLCSATSLARSGKLVCCAHICGWIDPVDLEVGCMRGNGRFGVRL